MSRPRRILIVAGEASGDRHAAGLMKEAARLDPSLRFTGVGGAAMREAGLDSLFDAESIAVVGFLEVIRHLPRLRQAFARCEEAIRQGKKRKRPKPPSFTAKLNEFLQFIRTPFAVSF